MLLLLINDVSDSDAVLCCAVLCMESAYAT